jgi:membrane associated rhomboid family serine protease
MSLPPPPPAPPPQQVLPRCYRHADREAGRSCTRCGKPACSDCLVQAAVGSHCLDCAKAAKPDLKTRANWWNARQHALVTTAIIAINVAVFVVMVLLDPGTLGGGGDISQFQFDYGLNRIFLQLDDQWYRLVTSGFLHFGIIHIAFNMVMLFQLGNLLERPLGRLRFGLLYLAGLLGGSLGVIILDSNSITAGASGAVFGLMAAAAVGLQRQGVNVFSTGLGTTLMLNFFITFAIPGISIGGHLGGAAAGAVCGLFMLPAPWKVTDRERARRISLLTPIAVAVVCAIASAIVAAITSP